jgi:hypothetical protein
MLPWPPWPNPLKSGRDIPAELWKLLRTYEIIDKTYAFGIGVEPANGQGG